MTEVTSKAWAPLTPDLHCPPTPHEATSWASSKQGGRVGLSCHSGRIMVSKSPYHRLHKYWGRSVAREALAAGGGLGCQGPCRWRLAAMQTEHQGHRARSSMWPGAPLQMPRGPWGGLELPVLQRGRGLGGRKTLIASGREGWSRGFCPPPRGSAGASSQLRPRVAGKKAGKVSPGKYLHNIHLIKDLDPESTKNSKTRE